MPTYTQTDSVPQEEWTEEEEKIAENFIGSLREIETPPIEPRQREVSTISSVEYILQNISKDIIGSKLKSKLTRKVVALRSALRKVRQRLDKTAELASLLNDLGRT